MNVKRNFICGASLFALGWSPVHAQSQRDAQSQPAPSTPAAPSNATSGNQDIQDIIVTAQRRAETVQSTPLAITASTGDDLRRRQITDVSGLSNTVPNVSIPAGHGPVHITMRGIGLSGSGLNVEAPVAFSVDGVFISRPDATNQAFYDVERVETVLGPQGTLYGRNATGGAINVITRDPTDEWEGYGQITVGNYSTLNGEAAISGPLANGVSIRIAYQGQRHSGYGVDGLGHDINDQNTQAFRAKLKITPTENLTFLIAGEYFDEDDSMDGLHYIRDSGFGPVNAAITLGASLPNPRDRWYNTNSTLPSIFRRTNRSGSLTANWDISSSLNLTSITAYRKYFILTQNDFDSSPLKLFSLLNSAKDKQFTQELRASGQIGNFNYVVGGFYFNDKLRNYYQAPINLLLIGGPDQVASGLRGLGELHTDAKAIFGQFGYDFTDWIGIDLGGRYSWERKVSIADKFDFSFTTPYTGTPAPFFRYGADPFSVVLPDRTFKDSRFTPKVTLRIKPARNVNAYLTYAEGFKSGGFNIGQASDPFNSEKLKDIEGGVKIDWFGGKLRTNFSAYHYKYSNLLVEILRPPPAVGTINANAGEAKLYGFEAAITAKPVQNLQIDANFSYSHARYTAFTAINTENPTGTLEDLKGNHLPFAPDVTIYLSAQYTIPTTFGDITPRLESNWVSRTYYTTFNTEAQSQKAYNRLNAYLNIQSPDGQWFGTAFVKNLTNNRVASALGPLSSFVGAYVGGLALPPRTFGVTLGRNF